MTTDNGNVRFPPIADVGLMGQHRSMNANQYFLPRAADDADLLAWASILPPAARILRTSLFGDVFLVDAEGTVHMLERGGCSVSSIAKSEEQFWHRVQEDEEEWQLRGLADACQDAGKVLGNGQCYAFTILPLLGGEYVPENVWVAPWQEWFGKLRTYSSRQKTCGTVRQSP